MAVNGRSAAAELTDRQLRALPYLVAAPGNRDGARLAQVGERTLYRWMEEYEFRRELERRRSEAAELAYVELKGLMLKAVQVLGDAMENPNPNVRLSFQ